MNRLSNFLMGLLVGAALMFVALKFHVIRGADGWHLIPKTTSQIGDIYVDIRAFDAQKWAQHKLLAVDIAHAKKQYLIGDSVGDDMRRQFQNTLRNLSSDAATP